MARGFDESGRFARIEKMINGSRFIFLLAILVAAILAMASGARAGQEPDYDKLFARYEIILSFEAGANRFGARLENPDEIQTWDLAAGLSVVPFGIFRFPIGGHLMDRALAVGIEPVFQRF